MAERHVSGDRISAFLDDELSEDRALAVTRHLADCERCFEELEELRATRDALRSLPSVTPPVLARGLDRRERRRRRWVRRLRVTVLTALAPVMLVTAAWVAGGIDGDVSPSTELFLVEHVSRTGGGPVPSPIGASER